MQDVITRALAWAAVDQPAGNAQAMHPEYLWMIVGFIGLFYFMVLRPGRNDQRQREQMIETLAKGDKVVTSGGVHGTIEGVDKANKTVTVAVAPKVVLTLNLSSISSVTAKKDKPKNDKAGGDDKAGKE
jgi:preprotein translocase subunit YajC